LVELLVVVSVIGILASIAMPSLADAQDKARNASMQANVRVVCTALEAYAADHNGMFPQDGEGDPPEERLTSTTAGRGLCADNYLPGNQLPLSPWGKLPQEVCINKGAVAGGSDQHYNPPGTPVAAGAVAARPSLIQHYGALGYDTLTGAAAAGGMRTIYVVHGIGKRRNAAVIALSRGNSPDATTATPAP
jgi:type II secretory pathway pseudopilin PulG